MCYNLSKNDPEDKLIQRYNKGLKAKGEVQTKLFVNGYTYPKLHIIKSEDSSVIDVANWGLVPSFIDNEVKAKDYASYTLNAKAETVFDLPSYKNSIRPRRCLIPVTGFFEWMDVKKIKFPFYIHLKEEEIFSLGGIYDEWVNKETGEIHTTFSIVTTPANPLMEKIHNLKKRMPLILTPENENEWIKPTISDVEIKNLMVPLDEKRMVAHTIRKINPRNVIQEKELIEEYKYSELETLKIAI